jgi:hypothetical protein
LARVDPGVVLLLFYATVSAAVGYVIAPRTRYVRVAAWSALVTAVLFQVTGSVFTGRVHRFFFLAMAMVWFWSFCLGLVVALPFHLVRRARTAAPSSEGTPAGVRDAPEG